MKSQIRVMCIEDHPVVREGITLKIDLQSDMKVVAAAGTGEQAVALFRQHRPDVTLMDLQLPGMSGLETIRAIGREDPKARIVVLTMYRGDEDIYHALQAGATTYLFKDTLSEDLIRVVREVHGGARPIPPDVAARLTARETQPDLTPREVQVLECIAQGMRNKEIAAALGISKETAPVHVKNIFAKLNVNDRTAALSVALHRGIIHIK